MSVKILGCGGYLPASILSNEDLKEIVPDSSSEWIKSRTGILQRHIANKEELTSDLAYESAKQAILDANIDKSEIDLIVVCTTTPDNTFPATATKVQGKLGIGNIPSFDLQAVCSGFVYGLQVVEALLNSSKYSTALLIGAEKMSSILDWTDRGSCVLFGDGAGAVVLSTKHQSKDSGVIDTMLYSEGTMYDALYTDGGVAMSGKSGKVRMKGQIVFKYAVERMVESIETLLKVNSMDISKVSHFIPHQANVRIMTSVAEKLGMSNSKVVNTIPTHANCSSASIPLALKVLKDSQRLNPGEVILISAFGAGFTWGSALIKW